MSARPKRAASQRSKSAAELELVKAVCEKCHRYPIMHYMSEEEEEMEEQEDEVYCICKGPDDGRFMILCDRCQDWYHGSCVGIRSEQADAISNFICHKCRNIPLKEILRAHGFNEDAVPYQEARGRSRKPDSDDEVDLDDEDDDDMDGRRKSKGKADRNQNAKRKRDEVPAVPKSTAGTPPLAKKPKADEIPRQPPNNYPVVPPNMVAGPPPSYLFPPGTVFMPPTDAPVAAAPDASLLLSMGQYPPQHFGLMHPAAAGLAMLPPGQLLQMQSAGIPTMAPAVPAAPVEAPANPAPAPAAAPAPIPTPQAQAPPPTATTVTEAPATEVVTEAAPEETEATEAPEAPETSEAPGASETSVGPQATEVQEAQEAIVVQDNTQPGAVVAQTPPASETPPADISSFIVQ